MSPKNKPTSLQNAIGRIFGPGLESFASGFPSQMDVVKRWICLFDNARGEAYRVSPKVKKELVHQITEEILSLWSGKDVKPKNSVIALVRDVIKRAENLRTFTRKFDDSVWISAQPRFTR